MRRIAEIEYQGLEEEDKYNKIAYNVLTVCFKEEDLYDYNIYVSIILSDEEFIKNVNSKYRDIDKVTDVLSFPMFEKEEINEVKQYDEVLGDIIICIPRIKEQAKEYGHSVEREFAYMLVHGFYHLMGYDHIEESEKKEMRKKEEVVLQKVIEEGLEWKIRY